MNDSLSNPFKGLAPYGPGEPLFGREADLMLMKDRIFRGRTTLLFAGSGVGKTSFFRARFIPDIERRYREQFVVRYHNSWAGKDPLVALKATLEANAESSAALPTGGGGTLLEFFRRKNAEAARTWVLVLDQFEELFQYHVYLPYFDKFRQELSEVINDSDTPVRIILAMREEFLGQLSAFDNRVPDLFANYYRLKNPDRTQANEIIALTSETVGARADERGLEALTEDLARVEVRAGGRKLERMQRDFVILPQLQLVCRGLWEQEAAQHGGAAEDFLFLRDYPKQPRSRKENPARRILRDFCVSCMEALSPDEQRIAARAFDFLVTSQGAKMAYELKSLAKHMGEDKKLLAGTLGKLSRETRILRESLSHKEHWFELYHDMYAPIMYEWKERFESEQRRKAALEDRARACDRRAVHAEARENRDEGLLLRLKALRISDTVERRRQVARLLGEVAGLAMTFRHDGPIVATGIRADSKQVVTASAVSVPRATEAGEAPPGAAMKERTLVQVWDAATGVPAGKPIEVEGKIRAVALSGDGVLVAAATDAELRLIETGSGSVIRKTRVPVEEHPFRPYYRTMRFSVDQECLLIEVRSGPKLTWAAVPVKPGSKPRWSRHGNLRLAFDAAGSRAALARPLNVSVLNARTAKPLGGTIPVRDRVTAVALSPDGKRVATGTAHGIVRVWDVDTAAPRGKEMAHSGPVRRVAFKNDGKTVVTLCGLEQHDHWHESYLLQGWDSEAGRAKAPAVQIPSRRSLVARLSPQGSFCYRHARWLQEPTIWNTQLGTPLEAPWRKEPGTRTEWSDDEKFALSGNEDGVARLWRTAALRTLSPTLTHSSGLVSAVLGADGSSIATLAGDGTVSIRDTSGKAIRDLPGAAATAVAFHSGRQLLATTGRDGVVHVRNVATLTELCRVKWPNITGMVFNPKGRALLLQGSDGVARWWGFASGETRPRLLRGGDLTTFSRGGRLLVTHSFMGETVKIWDSASGSKASSFRHKGGVRAVAVSEDGKWILSGGEDGRAGLWKAPEGTLVRALPHQGPVVAAAFSASGRYAATLAADQVVRVWSVEGQEIGRVRYEGSAQGLDFSPDERALMIASAFWVHLFNVGAAMEPRASRQLAGRWTGEYHFLATGGALMRVLVCPSHFSYRVDVVQFDTVEAEPLAGALPPLSKWGCRTALRFEGEEVAPAALARAAKPSAEPARRAGAMTPPKEAQAALKDERYFRGSHC